MPPDRDPVLDEDAELMDEVAPVERFLEDEAAPPPGAPAGDGPEGSTPARA